MRKFAERKQLRSTAYVGMQLPIGSGWREYCRQEQASSGGGGRGGTGECDMSAEAVTQVLEERQVGELSRILYVASGVLNISQVPSPLIPRNLSLRRLAARSLSPCRS